MAAHSSNEHRLSQWIAKAKKHTAKGRSAVVVRAYRMLPRQGSFLLFEEGLALADLDPGQLAAEWLVRLVDDCAQWAARVPYQVTVTREGEAQHYDALTLHVDAPPGTAVPAANDGEAGGWTPGGATGGRLPDYSAVAVQQASAQQSTALVQMGSMLIKHQEQMFGLYTAQILASQKMLAEQLEKKDTRVRELEEQRHTLLVLQEELLTTKAERELLTEQAKNDEKRKDAAMEKLFGFGSAVLAQWSGQGLTPAKQEAMRSFFSSFSGEQFEAIMEKLTPEQQALLMSLWQSAEEDAKGKTGGQGTPH